MYVYRSGLFAFAADNHEIRAPIASGSINESARSVELRVDARQLEVLDPQLSAEKRRQVQERMLGQDVLDGNRFPDIKFESGSLDFNKSNDSTLNGSLVLHGQTHAIAVRVTKLNERHFFGSATLRQSDFGITPIVLAGGTVRVKDQIKLNFDIFAR